MVKTYRIAHLEHKQIEARELLARLKHRLSIDCLNSVRDILTQLSRVLSDVEDTEIHAPPAGEPKEA